MFGKHLYSGTLVKCLPGHCDGVPTIRVSKDLPLHVLNVTDSTLEATTIEELASRGKATTSLALIFNLYALCVLYTGQALRYSPENAFIYITNKYISLSDICLTVHHCYK